MGLEAKCRARMDGEERQGKLHVDSLELTFRGEGWNWSFDLKETALEAQAVDGWLRVQAPGRLAEFELGEAAEKWLQKVLHPPGLRQKLGLKTGMKVWLDGDFGLDLEGCELCASLAEAELGFLLLEGRDDLGRFLNLAGTKKAVWVIYPKGGHAIRESEVMEVAKSLGMGASKTASINERLTGLRFMVRQ